MSPAVVPVEGVPPAVATHREAKGLAAIKPFTVRLPPIAQLLNASIVPIDKIAAESMDNSFLLVAKLKIHFSGETKVSIFG